MSRVDCSCCRNPAEERSMIECKGCGRAICPQCAQAGRGYCADCQM